MAYASPGLLDIIISEEGMDIVIGMVSIFKDLGALEFEYKNLNTELKRVLKKASRTQQKAVEARLKIGNRESQELDSLILCINNRVRTGQSLAKKLDELLTTDSIAIKDKLKLSMPFDQTKHQVRTTIELLEREISDIKEFMSEELNIDCKQMREKPGDESEGSSEPELKPTKNQLSVREVDEQIEQVYEMGPTLNEDCVLHARSRPKQYQFTVLVHSSAEIVDIIKKADPSILETKVKIGEKEDKNQILLYTASRNSFRKCYNKIKSLTKDIDGISKDGHFEVIVEKLVNPEAASQAAPEHHLRRQKKQQLKLEGLQISPDEKQNQNEPSEQAKRESRSHSSQKQEEEVFFSFPVSERDNPRQHFKILARKLKPKNMLYRMSGEEWIRVEEQQVELSNGDYLATFLDPGTKLPAIHYEVKFQQVA